MSPALAARLDRLVRAARLPARVGWRDHVLGAALAFVYVVWLLATARSLGFPRDEGVYFRAATDYVGWWRSVFEHGPEALKQSAIDGPWSDNHEHPVLMKTLFGVSWWFLHAKWRVFADASTAFRFPAMIMAGVCLWTTYLFGARAYGRRAGFVAAALLAFIPSVFFHAHLACFDVPIMTMWTLCVYVHWRAQAKPSLGWIVAAGVVYGLTLETKHNAWMLPAVLVPHALFVHRRAIWRAAKVGRVSLPASLVSMATIGPLVFYALWPYLWNETLPRLQWYVEFHLNHEYYNIEFLGRNYFGPPSPKSYLPVMILATVPTITLLLFGVGALDRGIAGGRRLVAWGRSLAGEARAHVAAPSSARGRDPAHARAVRWAAVWALFRAGLRRERRDPLETDLLLALSFGAAVGVFFLSKTPIFGGTKHWLPAYPALVLFAGRGFELVAQAMRRALSTLPKLSARGLLAAEAGLVASVLAAPLAITAHSHPFGIAAYVPLVGGTAGGASLGLNRQFWGYTTEDAAGEYLNPEAPRGASVYIDDTTWDAWNHMVDEKRVRGDLRAAGSPGDSSIALVQHELHMNEVDYSIWEAYGSDAPVYVVQHDGVPIVSIYRRP